MCLVCGKVVVQANVVFDGWVGRPQSVVLDGKEGGPSSGMKERKVGGHPGAFAMEIWVGYTTEL